MGEMMVNIYRRGRKLYIKYKVGERVIQRSTRLDDTPKNRRFLEREIVPELREKILSGKLEREIEEAKRPKEFSWYAEKYLRSKEHLKTYWELQAQVERIEKHFHGDVKKITRGDVRDFAEAALRSASPKTTRKYLGVLGAILDVAIDYEAIETNPAKNIKLPEHKEEERNPFSAEEVAMILDSARGWFRNYLAIAFYTGARPGEILAIRKEDVDLHNKTIKIEHSLRNGKVTTPKTRFSVRTVPIFDNLMPFVMGQLLLATNRLFPNDSGNHFTGSRTPRHHWSKLIKKLGIPYRDMYSTRHTFITHMLTQGELSILEIAQIVGHKNATQIMQHYARFIDGQHLKVKRSLNPFGDTGDTFGCNAI